MSYKGTLAAAVVVAAISFAAPGAAETSFVKSFARAAHAGRTDVMNALVRSNSRQAPVVIGTLVDSAGEARKAGDEERGEEVLRLAERMARAYGEVFSDEGQLRKVRRAAFDTRLSKEERTMGSAGPFVISISTGGDGPGLGPDNLVVEAGSTVRIVNGGNEPLRFTSMPFIGRRGLDTPEIAPGGYWERALLIPGDYYYICSSRKVLMGKVTVVASDGAWPSASYSGE